MTRISELTVDEFRQIVSETVRTTMDEILEDIEAMQSPGYIRSIQEARAQSEKGDTISLENLLNA